MLLRLRVCRYGDDDGRTPKPLCSSDGTRQHLPGGDKGPGGFNQTLPDATQVLQPQENKRLTLVILYLIDQSDQVVSRDPHQIDSNMKQLVRI